jgi:hypothetical protein
MNKLKLLPDLEVEDIFNLRERNATSMRLSHTHSHTLSLSSLLLL